MIDIVSAELKKYATKRQCEYIDAVLEHGSNAKAAEYMGVDRRTVDRAIACAKRRAVDAGVISVFDAEPKVLVLDIETAPLLANVWSLWLEAKGHNAILSDWYMLSFSAKWLGKESVIAMTLYDTKGYRPGSENDLELMAELHKLINKADYIIAHNGDKFDIKKINTRFLEHGFTPPTPYKSIDTLKICKRYFSFSSNRLDYVAQKLLGTGKLPNDGMELWQRCIAGDPVAWNEMKEYNIRDVQILEDVYYKLRAWDHLHPNFAVHTDKEELSCTVCGSPNVKPTGDTVKTTTGAYLGFKCGECGHQMRGKTNVRTFAQTQSTLRNAK